MILRTIFSWEFFLALNTSAHTRIHFTDIYVYVVNDGVYSRQHQLPLMEEKGNAIASVEVSTYLPEFINVYK